MEETQAIDFDDLPSDEGPLQLDIHQVAGELQTVSEPADRLPLYLGLNVVGRGSSQADQEVMLNKWKADFSGMPVHGVFLQNNSISSTHAVIYLESAGAVCWIKDTGSRNKTLLGRAGGLTVLQSKGDRYSVLPGDKLRFGTVDTIITYSTTYDQADTAGGVQPGSDHGYSSHATEGQQHVSRSPTPDMAAAQVPSAPAAATDNDMTLPWDDPLDEQPELRHKSSPGNAAVNSETEVHEPSHAAEQPMTEAPILPDTQANDPPDDTGAGLRKLSTGPQDLAFAEPTQLADAPTHLMGEPTQLMGEPTELAVPAHPAAAAPSAAPGSQAGTALASAAAQAMTGAHPSQASALPSSGGFPTAMPSLADPPPAPAPSPAGSALAQNSGPVQGMSKSLPMSGPEADAVLHLPSQPSGSQHAAHPHGPPRTHEAGSSAASKPGSDTQNQQAGAGEQSHHDQTQQGVAGSHRVQGDSAAAGAGSSDHNTLLDSVLGHDDDDSIWMPPASLPESEGGPHEGGEDMPLQLQAPTAGAAEGSAPAAVSIPPAAQQVSDSDQTQDFPPEAIHADADGTSAPPAATRGPAHQGNAGRALPHAEEGMYTGAFAFPDSASLEVSQPALDLPHKPGKGRPVTAAARPAARGKAAKAAAAAKAGKEPAVQGKGTAAEAGKKSASAVRDDSADVAKDASSAGAGAGGGASAGASPKGRVMPSGWKKKKAEPVADGHADSAAEEAAEAAGPSAELPAGALQDQGPHVAAQKEEAAPSSTHIAHGAGKPTPWRVRGTPLGVGPAGGPSQLPNSEDINAAMAAAGDLAACFPSTQAEQEVDASLHAHTTLEPRSNTGTTAAGAAAAAPPSKSVAAAAVTEKSNPAATRKEQDGVQGITAAAPQQPSASTDAEHGHDPKAASQSGHTSAEAEQQQGASAEADSRSADEASHGQPDEAEDVQSHRGAGQRQTSRRKQVGRAAVDEEEEEDHGSAGVRGRGRGSRGKGRGRGQARGRKRSSPDAETEEDATKVGKPQVKAAKGKEGRSRDSREASPALQPTRVSKRQKAKAEAQAADAAQQEEEEDHNPEDDTFFGAATQAAAGILEDLRRSATPDEDADMHEAAEAGPPVPALQPSMKGRRSTAKRTAHAAPAADPKPAVAAAEAPAQDHAVPDSQVSGKSSRPKRRASPQSKAAAGSRGKDTLPGQEDSAGGSNAAASTAAAQSTGHDSTAAGGASEGQEEGSVPVKRGQKRRAGADSTGQGRRKSRLSKASSPAPDPSLVADDPSETLAKLLGPARRGDLAKQLQAEKQQKTDDRVSSAPKRKSGMGSTAVKAQGAAAHGTAPEQGKEAAGSGSGSLEEAVEDRAAGTSKASSSRGKAKRKSAPTRGDDEQPPAEAAGGRRGSNGSQSASKQAAAASTAHVAADESGGNAVASKAKQAPRAKQLAARRHSQATSAAAVAKEEAQPSGGRERGPQAKASTARAASQSQDAAAEGNGQEEERNEDEDEADPPVRQPGGDSAAAGKGAQAKGKAVRGKRSRQSMEEDAAADVGPAGHVKAARKATDSNCGRPVRVLYSTALDKAKKSSMTKVIKRLGGSVEDAEGPDFTHFVALQPTAANQTDRGFKKSINALIALAAGRPIVSESWVEACNRSSSFVDALDHLLIDKAAQKKYGFDLRTSYERAQHQLLLSGLHIFFTPGALAGESDGGTNIQNLVEHAGGVVEKQLPKSASSKDSEVWSQWLLVGSENDKNKDQKMCRKQFAAGLTFHGRSMLIDSIMQQSLDRKHGVLFTT